jgi:lipoprotein signal peptidase
VALTHAMLRWMAPFLSFTAEEAWKVFAPSGSPSIFVETYSDVAAWRDPALLARWSRLREIRDAVNKEIEALRAEGRNGSSLQAEIAIRAQATDLALLALARRDLKFVLITSGATAAAGPALTIEVTPSDGAKCERCWHWRHDIGKDPAHPTLCGRCTSNLYGAGEPRAIACPMAITHSDKPIASIGPWLGIAAVVILLDQLTKTLILRNFQLGETHVVTPFFNIVRWHNTGAAFSFLAHAAGWQRWFFVALGLAATAFILWMLLRHGGQRLFSAALALILGGALGNVIDRLLHGHVIDFIQVHWGSAYFPSFNVADSAITIGAGMLILDELLRVRRGR